MRTDNARIICVCERTTDNGRMKRKGNGHRLYRHRPGIYIPSACHPRTLLTSHPSSLSGRTYPSGKLPRGTLQKAPYNALSFQRQEA